jgi:hypothetical protein
LKKELAFWQATAPGLPIGWWNSLKPDDQRVYYTQRYGVLAPTIRAVVSQHYTPGREVVLQLRDLWTSLPQLNDKSGLNEMTERCNKALQELQIPARSPEPRN